MSAINSFLDTPKQLVKKAIRRLAYHLNKFSNGQVSPNSITITGALAHLPIAYAISQGQLTIAGIGLIIFGLFDTLDGELARLQKSTSASGMFLDSVTDRIKEVLIYVGLAAYLLNVAAGWVIIVAVGALGAALITSYINAWGEVVLAVQPQKKTHEQNKALRIGIGGFEIRMALLVIGLLFNQLPIILCILLIISTLTVAQRMTNTLQRI